jgi:hypothetical protein
MDARNFDFSDDEPVGRVTFGEMVELYVKCEKSFSLFTMTLLDRYKVERKDAEKALRAAGLEE